MLLIVVSIAHIARADMLHTLDVDMIFSFVSPWLRRRKRRRKL